MLLQLFERFLAAEYTHTEGGGDYAVRYEKGTLYLLFEWSDGANDWKRNVDFPAAPYKHMEETWYCRGIQKTPPRGADRVRGLLSRRGVGTACHREYDLSLWG